MKTKKNKKTTIAKAVSAMTKNFQESLALLVEKLSTVPIRAKTVKSIKIAKSPSVENEEKSLITPAHERFLITLKLMNRPAMTKEIAGRIKLANPTSEFPKSKKALMQELYSSASFLAKEGLIERNSIGKRIFEYSLPKEKAEAVAA